MKKIDNRIVWGVLVLFVMSSCKALPRIECSEFELGFGLIEFINNVILGLGVTIVFTVIYLSLKPKIGITDVKTEKCKNGETTIRIKISNLNHEIPFFQLRRFFIKRNSILNIKVEASFIECGKTYTLKFDEDTILFLPPIKPNATAHERVFVSGLISN